MMRNSGYRERAATHDLGPERSHIRDQLDTRMNIGSQAGKPPGRSAVFERAKPRARAIELLNRKRLSVEIEQLRLKLFQTHSGRWNPRAAGCASGQKNPKPTNFETPQ